MTNQTPRSVRNNNPGNILRTGIAWEGLCPRERMTPEQLAETEFCVFVSPAWGFRALALDLHTKWAKDGLRTIRQIIAVYAPPNENDTGAYIATVCKITGAGPDDELNLGESFRLEALCRAIATVEAGGWDGHWTDDNLNTAINLLPAGTVTLSAAPLTS